MTKLHVGAGERRGSLTVFPVWQERLVGRAIGLSTPQAVSVQELATPDVPRLQVTNTSSKAVLVIDGDLMIGGQQNRVAIGSTLIKNGETLEIEVRCVEQERWHGDRRHETGRERASAFVRGVTNQGDVWRRVHLERGVHHAPPDVSDLRPLPGQSGILIAVGGVPVLLELFADDELLAAAWDRIIHAAARDAASRPSRGTSGHAAREFVAAVGQLNPVDSDAAGMGRRIVARSARLELRGIRDDHRVLHLSVLAVGSAA